MATSDDRSRVVLVLGATSGIGLASALEFARSGARLVLAARSADALESAAQRCRSAGAAAVDVQTADVGRRDDVEAVVRGCVGRHGHLDVVVLTATTMAYGSLTDLPLDIFERVVTTAIFGTTYVARAVLPVFAEQGGGTLVVVNSLLGSVTVPFMGAYAVAKWGQRAVVRTLQQEVRGQRGVHVCMVSPGSVNTPIYYQAANHAGREARPPIPVRAPESVGRVIARLADHPRQHVSVPVGPVNPVVITGFRLLPFVYDRIVRPLLRVGSLRGPQVGARPGNVHEPRPDLERMHGHWPDPRNEVDA